MGQPASQVDSAGLKRVGAAVTRSAAEFSKAYTARSGALAAPAGMNDWATGPALTATADAWEVFFKQLAEQVGKLGSDLSRSADAYLATDDDADDRIRTAGRSPAGLPR